MKAGKASECADAVFSIYRNSDSSDDEKRLALITLSEIAAPEHRTAIIDDLLSGSLNNNKLIAAGLAVAGIESLEEKQLASIFSKAQPESEYGGGPITNAVKFDICPNLSFESALKLLKGLLASLPIQFSDIQGENPVSDMPLKSWIPSVLPSILLHVLQKRHSSKIDFYTIQIKTAGLLERLGFFGICEFSENLPKLRSEIEMHEEFRKYLVIEIARSLGMPNALWRLTVNRGLIDLSEKDLGWLVQNSLRKDGDKFEQQICFAIASNIAFLKLRGHKRKAVFLDLTRGVDVDERRCNLIEEKQKRITILKQNRNLEKGVHRQKSKSLEEEKMKLFNKIDLIRNGTWFDGIRYLFNHTVNHGAFHSFPKINSESIYSDFGSELGDAFSEGLAKVWHQVEIPDPAHYLNHYPPGDELVGLGSVNCAIANGLNIDGLTANEVSRAVRLCIWKSGKPEPWFERLVETHATQMSEALMPWLEFELELAEETSERRTIDLALQSPIAFKRIFLERALELLTAGRIPCEPIQRKLLHEFHHSEIISKEGIKEIISMHLLAGLHQDPRLFPSKWFAAWAEIDFPSAWCWIEENHKLISLKQRDLAEAVAGTLADSSWSKHLTGTNEEIDALLALYRFLDKWMPRTEEDSVPLQRIQTVKDGIPNILFNMRGESANRALQQLAMQNVGTPYGAWLLNQVQEHASVDAELNSKILPADVNRLGDIYTRNPRTEKELFDQVMARLEEIIEGMEKGPFSERDLFVIKMPEKCLQLWLADRLADTPQRKYSARFGVTREPQVDSDKRTDIEVSHAALKVCIEIKPLDFGRGYTATSLAKTLRDQLVGQYMKGKNSKNVILVLFRLDRKKWKIPDSRKLGEFKDLVDYLKRQSSLIKNQNDRIEKLDVIGIDCTSE